jgi:hypothetical protein
MRLHFVRKSLFLVMNCDDCVQVALGADDAPICADPGPQGRVEVARGYGHPDTHVVAPEKGICQRFARRKPGTGFVPPDVEVGAIRISATGWEGWVIEGLKVCYFLQSPLSILCTSLTHSPFSWCILFLSPACCCSFLLF